MTLGFYFKAADSQPKEKGLSRRRKVLLSNGKVANGGLHLTNGSHSRAALNSDDSQEGSVNELLNGNHTGNENYVPLLLHLAFCEHGVLSMKWLLKHFSVYQCIM